jgi:hypothetical protein
MTILATASDIETFIQERSPHVKMVEVYEDDEHEHTVIRITLNFWYRFFYERTFYHYITNLIKENQMYGIEYDIVLTS